LYCLHPNLRRCLGIGKSIATRLAQQGLSVVLVALQNEALDATYEELSTEYPKVEFRKVSRLQWEKAAAAALQRLCLLAHLVLQQQQQYLSCAGVATLTASSHTRSIQYNVWHDLKFRLYCCTDRCLCVHVLPC
jgi:NADP-dependent 3-hydroxy acid dehydrogenase YdfG